MQDKEIVLLLGQIDGKLDRVISKQSDQDSRSNSHGERLRSLESSRSTFIGAHTVLGAIISFVVSWYNSHRG